MIILNWINPTSAYLSAGRNSCRWSVYLPSDLWAENSDSLTCDYTGRIFALPASKATTAPAAPSMNSNGPPLAWRVLCCLSSLVADSPVSLRSE